jgi:hypothetical protein
MSLICAGQLIEHIPKLHIIWKENYGIKFSFLCDLCILNITFCNSSHNFNDFVFRITFSVYVSRLLKHTLI